jgi:hypothetical protein
MQWTSIAEISANLDPNYRVQKQKQQMQLYIAQGKMEQDERHHSEMMRIHQQKMESERERSSIEAHASIEKEIIAGKNAIALADRNHVLGQLAGGSAIIDDMIRSQLKQEEDWNATYADTMRQLFVTEGDTIRQTKIRELEHRHAIETKVFEFNTRIIEMYVQNHLMDSRIAFDKTCEIIFRLVERALGLGQDMASMDDVARWTREAMDGAS